MKKTTNFILIFVIITLLILGYLAIFTTVFQKNNPNNDNSAVDFDNLKVSIRDMSKVPSEYFSGNSRYSHGSCQTDSNCFNIGCSLEMCSSDKDLMTTCVIDGDFPDKDKYACGCIKDTCGWFIK